MVTAIHGDRHPADVDRVTTGHGAGLDSGLGKLRGARGIGDDLRLGVGRQERAEPADVEMVVVLVGDEHARQVGEPLETGGKDPRIEQQPGVADLDQQAGVAKLRQGQ